MAIKRPRLKLTKGQTYTFDVSDPALATHPFKFTADSGTSEYTTGVTLTGTQGQAGAVISLTVSDSAPTNLNYYCGDHGLSKGNHVVIIAASAGGGGGNAAANGFIVRNNFTGMSNERFYGIGTDTSNNFYATGYDAVDDNILIAKYNSSGTFQWARKTANAGNGPDRIFGSQVDTSGNVITGGYAYSHSGGSPYPALITKYQPDGTHVYTKVFTDGGTSSWIGQATAIDSNDNFYITGRGGAYSSANNNDYTFVAKLNSAGAIVWIQKLDHGGQQSNGRGLAIDSNDNVIVTGAIHEQITGGGYSSGFVAKLSGTDGSIIWQKIMNDNVQANGYHNDSFYAVTVDSNDDVYTTGWTNFEYLNTYYTPVVKLSGTDGSVTWQRRHLTEDGSPSISAVGTSIYIVTDNNKILIYNASGTLTGEWAVTATSGSYYVEGVEADQNGNAVIVGFYYSAGGQAEPFFAVLPSTIIAGTSDNFVLTAGTLGDVAGTLATNAFTTMSSNAASSVTVSNASNMASSTQASDGNVITPITGGTGTWSGGIILSQLPANSGGRSTSYADDGQIATNGTYTVVGDPRMNIGTINQPGWAWIYRNSDGKEMASFNSILDGHAPNDSQLYSRNGNGAFASSKYHKMYFGQRVAINDTYAFVTAPISYSANESNWGNGQDGTGQGQPINGYVSVIRLSDMTHVRTIRMSQSLYSTGPSYVAGATNWGGTGIAATNDWLAIGATHADVGTGNTSGAGAIEVFNISDANPANWTSSILENVYKNSGNANLFNFGYGIAIEGNKLASNHRTVLQAWSWNGSSWVPGSSSQSAFPNGNSAPDNLFMKNDKIYYSRTTGSPNYDAFIEARTHTGLSLLFSKQINEGNAYPGYSLMYDDSDHIFTADASYNDGNANAGRIMAYTLDSANHVANFDTQSLQGQGTTNNYYGETFDVSKGWLISKETNQTPNPDVEYLTFRDYRSAVAPSPPVLWYGDRGIIFNASSSLDGGSNNQSQRIEYFDITTTGNAAAFGLMTQKQDNNNAYNTDRGASNGSRAVACLYHGPYPGTVGSLEYVTPSTLGNSVAFGTNTFKESLMGLSDGTKAYYAGGPWGGEIYPNQTNLGTNIEVVTIDTTGNATDTGYSTPNQKSGGTHGNSTRGIFAGGAEDNNSKTTDVNYSDQMFYITFPLSSNSSDFGNLSLGRANCAGTGSDTRAVFGGGYTGANHNTIDYVTIATTGNASDFGDLTVGRNKLGATGNNIRGVFISGFTGSQVDTMDYITFATTGNAIDFGDMTAVGTGAQAMSGAAA